jgi:hypothetical protein
MLTYLFTEKLLYSCEFCCHKEEEFLALLKSAYVNLSMSEAEFFA